MADRRVARVQDIGPGERLVIKLNDREIGIFNVGGTFFALPNVCPHQRGPLCRGGITGTLVAREDESATLDWVAEGAILRCAWHFIEFDVRTGECLANQRWNVKPIRVEVRGDEIYLPSDDRRTGAQTEGRL